MSIFKQCQFITDDRDIEIKQVEIETNIKKVVMQCNNIYFITMHF